ncbi:HEAT repeat domain-containing protein [Candidatus Micrarchaeota archaeon]|nr:HEAT repeat domain-containing protein [Candidatus Micrarchaeota archaeon]
MSTHTEVKQLIRDLKSSDASVSLQALHRFTKITDATAVPELLRALRSGDKQVMDAAGLGLISIGEPAVALLVRALRKEKNWGVKCHCAYALGEIGDAYATRALLSAIRGKDFLVKTNCLQALGKIRDPSASSALVRLLGNKRLREDAARVLGEIGAPAAPELAKALKNKITGSRAAKVLLKIGEPSVPALMKALQGRNDLARRRAATVLSGIGGTSTATALTDALRSRSEKARVAASHALIKVQDDRATPHLICALGDSSAKVRKNAAIAIEKAQPNSMDDLHNLRRQIKSLVKEHGKDCPKWMIDSLGATYKRWSAHLGRKCRKAHKDGGLLPPPKRFRNPPAPQKHYNLFCRPKRMWRAH